MTIEIRGHVQSLSGEGGPEVGDVTLTLAVESRRGHQADRGNNGPPTITVFATKAEALHYHIGDPVRILIHPLVPA